MGVAEDFVAFKNNYNISAAQMSSIRLRYRRITTRLNHDFWGLNSDTDHSLYVGSYGRDTAANGISDLDIGFRLPPALYWQYDKHSGNGQSALLQAVRASLRRTYDSSDVGGDGQVVVIAFTDGITFEILPYFDNQARTWTYPDSHDGGSWKTCNPRAEIKAMHDRNLAVNRNLKHLCRMMRVWKDYNDVPMTGALLDTLAYQFIENWEHRDKSFLYHDYMARDFFKYLYDQNEAQQYWLMPGSGSRAKRTGVFWRKALTDYKIAVEACNLQNDSGAITRRAKWRSVFGPTFPV